MKTKKRKISADYPIIISFVIFVAYSYYGKYALYERNDPGASRDPLYAAFPVAYILRKKGTSAVNIFIYLGASSIAKIPMVTFEIGFLGLKFSLLRIFLSLPVFILIGIMMGNYFEKNKCTINDV